MIEIVTTSPLNSVQDLGRRGHRAIGVGKSGAMDELALRLGNLLLDNPATSAAIEVQTFPFAFRVRTGCFLAVTGAVAKVTVGRRRVPGNWCFAAEENQVVRLERPVSGARCYVAIRGGIDCPVVLDSRSTSIASRFGGHEGRHLQVGDCLPVSHIPADSGVTGDFGAMPPQVQLAFPGDSALPAKEIAVRAIPAGEYDLFADESKAAFWASPWKISVQSNRMGYRFAGPELKLRSPAEMRSYGVMAGLVQVPPGGQPIVQLSDANTMGGYPKIATIIEADLWRMGQAGPGQSIRFVEASYEEGCQALEKYEDYLASVGRLRALYVRRPRD
jgi:biotin-dependent carboxylase-like uncharacterized protein